MDLGFCFSFVALWDFGTLIPLLIFDEELMKIYSRIKLYRYL